MKPRIQNSLFPQTIRPAAFDSMVEEQLVSRDPRGAWERAGIGLNKMRRMLMLGVICLAGCQSVLGPFQPRSPSRVDAPGVSLPEQESRARDRYALPDETSQAAPPSGNVFRR